MAKRSRSRSSRKQRKRVRERSERAQEHGLPGPSLPRVPSLQSLRLERAEPRNRGPSDEEAEAPVSEITPSRPRGRSARRNVPAWAKVLAVATLAVLAMVLLARLRQGNSATDDPLDRPPLVPAKSRTPPAVEPVPPPTAQAPLEPISVEPPGEMTAEPAPSEAPPLAAPTRSARVAPVRPKPPRAQSESAAPPAGPASGAIEAVIPPPAAPSGPVAAPDEQDPN